MAGEMRMNDLYTTEFFDRWAPLTKKAAEIIVPIVLDLVPAKSILDVGCGLGHWLNEFNNNGVKDIVGIDGDHVPRNKLEIARFIPHDLTLSFNLDRKFDLAISLEVAEHLPTQRAEAFIEDITKHAPVVLFSAAIPGQDGTGHINCQWPSWWAGLFARQGFDAYDSIRPKIWNNASIAWWYRQNILLFANKQVDKLQQRFNVAGPDINRVHPQHWREKMKAWG
jgi:SAM-dependent methyltransferase